MLQRRVQRLVQGERRDPHRLGGARGRHPPAGDHGGHPHARVRVPDGLAEQGACLGQRGTPAGEQAGAPGAVAEVVGRQQALDQRRIRLLMGREHAAEFVKHRRRRLGEVDGPQGREHLRGGQPVEPLFGGVALPAFRRGEVGEQFLRAERAQGRTGHRRPSLRGHAPDPTMRLVAPRVAVARLVVADHRVEPVRDVDRALRTDARLDRAELLAAREQVAQVLGAEARALVAQAVELDLAGEVGALQQHPAQLLRQVATAEDLGLHALAPRMRQARRQRFGMQRRDEPGRGMPQRMVGAAAVEHLPLVVPGRTPAVQTRRAFVQERIEPQRPRVEAPEAAAVEFGEAVRRLDVGPDMVPLGEPEAAIRPPAQRVGVLVRVARAETAEDRRASVGFAVRIAIRQVHELGALDDVESAAGLDRGELEAERHRQTLREPPRLVRLPVAVGILEHEDEIPAMLAGLQLRVGRRARDPKPAALVPADLHRADHAEGLVGEEVDLEAGSHLETRQLLGRRRRGRVGAQRQGRRIGRRRLVGDEGADDRIGVRQPRLVLPELIHEARVAGRALGERLRGAVAVGEGPVHAAPRIEPQAVLLDDRRA